MTDDQTEVPMTIIPIDLIESLRDISTKLEALVLQTGLNTKQPEGVYDPLCMAYDHTRQAILQCIQAIRADYILNKRRPSYDKPIDRINADLDRIFLEGHQ